MKQTNKKKLNFLLYTIVLALIWASIYVVIGVLLPTNDILGDFLKSFTFVIIGGILTYIMFFYFRGFHKKGSL